MNQIEATGRIKASRDVFTKIMFTVLALTLALATETRADSLQFRDLRGIEVKLHEGDCMTSLLEIGGTTKLHREEEVVFMEWNVESVLKLRGKFGEAGLDKGGRYHREPLPNDDGEVDIPNWKFQAKQRKIEEAARLAGLARGTLPHFIVAPEVESSEASDRLFNSGPLAGRYEDVYIVGNDTRGINTAFAVRADLDVTIEARTHRFVKWHDPHEAAEAYLFTRDLGMLIVRDRETLEVVAVLFGQHGKSMRHRSKKRDLHSNDLRRAQYEASRRILESAREEFGYDVPIIMAGDFNADVRTAEEIAPIRSELVDAFALVNVRNRATHTYHPEDGPMIANQLDAFFVSDGLSDHVVRAMVVPEFDRVTGQRRGLPMSQDERDAEYPSDHRAILMTIEGRAFEPRGARWDPLDGAA